MRGIWTALITPFGADGKLDLAAYRKILHDQRDARVAGVVPCGTTGESPALSSDEKKELIQVAVQEMRGSGVKVAAGTGSNNTTETLELSRWASDQGVDAVLVVTPYYNKPSPAGLEAHFRAVAGAVACEVILYNVPGRTGVSLTPATIALLASHPRIRTLKEATGNVAFTSEILDNLATTAGQPKLDILSGDDATFLPLLAVGATGVISVASNLFPRAMVEMQMQFEAGRVEAARELHRRFYPLFRDLFIDANPVPIKAAMAYAGWCEPRVRMPLVALAHPHAEKLKASLRQARIEPGKPQ